MTVKGALIRIVKWLGVVVVVLTAVVFAALIIGSRDIERPDDATIRVELSVRPPDCENVYLGFVAATNAVRVKAEGNPMLVPADEADRLVATNVEALAIFREAANRRVWYDVDVRDGGGMIVGITGLMHLYQLVRTKARRDVEQGRIVEARQDATDLMAFASKMSEEAETRPTWMIARSFCGSACSIALDILATGKASDADLAALKTLVGERAAMKFDVRRLVYADFRYSLTRQLWRGPNPSLRERYSLHPNRTLAEIIARLQEVVAMLEKGYDRTIGSQRASGDGMMPGQWCLFPNVGGRSFADMFLASWLSWPRMRALDAFGCLAAETCLAAEQFRRANGRVPAALDELVPKFLSAVPIDPFESSRPLSYDAERGVIWTIGPDGDYNGQMRTSRQILLGARYARRLDGRRIRTEEGEKEDLKR